MTVDIRLEDVVVSRDRLARFLHDGIELYLVRTELHAVAECFVDVRYYAEREPIYRTAVSRLDACASRYADEIFSRYHWEYAKRLLHALALRALILRHLYEEDAVAVTRDLTIGYTEVHNNYVWSPAGRLDSLNWGSEPSDWIRAFKRATRAFGKIILSFDSGSFWIAMGYDRVPELRRSAAIRRDYERDMRTAKLG